MSAMWTCISDMRYTCDIDIYTAHVLHDRHIWNGSFFSQYHLLICIMKTPMKYFHQVCIGQKGLIYILLC